MLSVSISNEKLETCFDRSSKYYLFEDEKKERIEDDNGIYRYRLERTI